MKEILLDGGVGWLAVLSVALIGGAARGVYADSKKDGRGQAAASILAVLLFMASMSVAVGALLRGAF